MKYITPFYYYDVPGWMHKKRAAIFSTRKDLLQKMRAYMKANEIRSIDVPLELLAKYDRHCVATAECFAIGDLMPNHLAKRLDDYVSNWKSVGCPE